MTSPSSRPGVGRGSLRHVDGERELSSRPPRRSGSNWTSNFRHFNTYTNKHVHIPIRLNFSWCSVSLFHFFFISYVKSTISLRRETSETNPSISLRSKRISLKFHKVVLRTENERRTQLLTCRVIFHSLGTVDHTQNGSVSLAPLLEKGANFCMKQ